MKSEKNDRCPGTEHSDTVKGNIMDKSMSAATTLRDVSAHLNSRVASQTASLLFSVLSMGRI